MTHSPLRCALAASLLANVFAAGAIGGGLVMLSHQNTVRPAAPPLRPIRAAGDGLPPAARDRFRTAMRQVVADADGLIRTAREGRETAAQLFIQPQFDRGAADAALGRARDADVQLRSRLEAAAVGFAAGLSANERILLAQGLEQGGPLRHPPREPTPAP